MFHHLLFIFVVYGSLRSDYAVASKKANDAVAYSTKIDDEVFMNSHVLTRRRSTSKIDAAAKAAAAVTRNFSSLQQERKQRHLPGVNLFDLWNIEEPLWDYSGNEDVNDKKFRLRYEVNDMIEDSMFTSSWWTKDCKDGGQNIEVGEGIGFRYFYESDGQPPGDGMGTRWFNVAFEAAPNVFDNPDIYTETYDSHGRRYSVVEVCVRASLVTPGSGMEVNFLESVLHLEYDLSDGFFTLEAFDVRPPEVNVTSIDMGTIILAYDCSTSTDEIKSQGMTLMVCIEPVQAAAFDGFRMKEIESFRYEKLLQKTGEVVTQEAVVNGAQSQNELSRLTCPRGGMQCVVETMLIAVFYNEMGPVDAVGVATMQLGNYSGVDLERRKRTLLRRGGNNNDDNIHRRRRVLQPGLGLGINEGKLPETFQQDISVPFELAEMSTEQEGGSSVDENNDGDSWFGPEQGFSSSYSRGATVGIIVLLLLNISVLIVLIFQLPHFKGRRFYLS